MRVVLWVALAGAAGSVLRYLVAGAVNQRSEPWGTVLVNVVGAFLLGVLVGWFGRRSVPEELRTALGVGLLGGFTTFSAWAVETVDLVARSRPGLAAVNVVVPVVAGLAAAVAGLAVGRSL